MTDFEKLAMCSEMAKKRGGDYELIEISDYDGIPSHIGEPFSFHPNGNCGCMLLNDDYAFGIRCDHLLWAEGQCEGIESFWTEKDMKIAEEKAERGEYGNYNAILVYGNHKGTLRIKLLAFHEK